LVTVKEMILTLRTTLFSWSKGRDQRFWNGVAKKLGFFVEVWIGGLNPVVYQGDEGKGLGGGGDSRRKRRVIRGVKN